MARSYVRQNVVNRMARSYVRQNVVNRIARSYVRQNVVNHMARSYVRQNVVNRFELKPRSGKRSYDSLFFKFRRNSSRDIRLRKILVRTYE